MTLSLEKYNRLDRTDWIGSWISSVDWIDRPERKMEEYCRLDRWMDSWIGSVDWIDRLVRYLDR